MEAIIIGLEEKLKNVTEKNNDFAPLWESWCANKRILTSFMQIIIGAFPHYSLHDVSHSRNIINNVEMFLGNNRIDRFSPTDIWLLLNSIYSHDIGMIAQKTLDSEWNSENFQEYLTICKSGENGSELASFANICSNSNSDSTPISIHLAVIYLFAEYQRKNHAKFSAQIVTRTMPEIDLTANGTIPYRFIEWIGKIVQSHGEDFDFILSLNEVDSGFCRDYIHPRLLSALLCLGDVLDMDNSRFHKFSELLIDKRPPSSESHFQKHESIRQLLISPEYIEITADFGTGNPAYHDSYRSLRQWCDLLRKLIENMALNWNNIMPSEIGGKAPFLKGVHYIADDKLIDSQLAELKFSISQRRAFEFIEGTGIYDDDSVFLRELLQNAIDATKIQFWKDIESRVFSSEEIDYDWNSYGFQPFNIKKPEIMQRYKIIIEIEPISKKKIKLRVLDQGTGMGKADILNMSNAGNSYRVKEKRKLIDSMPKWLRPTGSFGIGLQSLFLITPTFSCKTRSQETNESYKIEFSSTKEDGYLNIYETKENLNYGTCFEVDYSNDIYIRPEIFPREISQQAYSLYGEHDFFTQKNPIEDESMKSQLGSLYLYTLLERYISKDNLFFPIDICIANTPNTISFDNTFFKSFDMCKDNNVRCYTYFDHESMIGYIWNYKEEYYATISLSLNKVGNITFKGISVPNSHISCSNVFTIDLDLFGWDAEEVLLLNRKKLRNDFDLSDTISEIESLYKSNFVKNLDNIVANLNSAPSNDYIWYSSIVMLLSDNTLPKEESQNAINELLALDLDFVISGYSYDNERDTYLKDNNISAKVLLQKLTLTETSEISIDSHSMPFENNPEQFLNENKVAFKKATIYTDNLLSSLVRNWYDQKVIYDKNGNVTIQVKTKKSVAGTQLDSNVFFNRLFHYSNIEDKRTILTNCISPYNTLALNEEKIDKHDVPFFLSINQSYFGFVSTPMLIPISEFYAKNIKNMSCTKDEITTEILQSTKYQKILDFTFSNQYAENQYSKEQINDCYQILINDIIDIILEPKLN